MVRSDYDIAAMLPNSRSQDLRPRPLVVRAIPPQRSLDGAPIFVVGWKWRVGGCDIPPKRSLDGAPIFVVGWKWRVEGLCYPTQAKLGWGTHF